MFRSKSIKPVVPPSSRRREGSSRSAMPLTPSRGSSSEAKMDVRQKSAASNGSPWLSGRAEMSTAFEATLQSKTGSEDDTTNDAACHTGHHGGDTRRRGGGSGRADGARGGGGGGRALGGVGAGDELNRGALAKGSARFGGYVYGESKGAQRDRDEPGRERHRRIGRRLG
nr:hypothetical protein CFP56_64766 [Quercus suber]